MAANPFPSNLDESQIIQRVMDEANDRLRVDAIVTATIADVIINAGESSIAIGDQSTGDLLTVNPDGTIDVNTVINATIDNILVVGTTDGTLTGTQKVLKTDSFGKLEILQENSIVPFAFDTILPTYPNSTTEIYVYKQASSTVATVTILYVDSSKNQIISIIRT